MVRLLEEFNIDSGSLYDYVMTNTDFDKTMRARWTASYGKSYDYNNMTYEAIPFPDIFTNVLNEIEREIGFRPNNCLINLYHDGNSSMGYHSDNTDVLNDGTGVVIISLGSDRILRFKSKTDPTDMVDFNLINGSLFYMDDVTQSNWLHSIPKSDTTDPRISLTFRDIK
jgi:alkylated DNA repair dioxygenase AlkB